jgi:hypothetical protein
MTYFGPNRDKGGAKTLTFVYADGRVISQRHFAFPNGANDLSSGFLEQRLTRDGLELMRSVAVATGMIGDEHFDGEEGTPIWPFGNRDDDFAIGPDAVAWEATEPVPRYTDIQIRERDRLIFVARARDLERLVQLLEDPVSSLPASAWAAREPRAYVPTEYAVCWGGSDREPSHAFAMLPARARDLVRTHTIERSGPHVSPPFACVNVPTDEARAIVETLNDGGYATVAPLSAYRLDYVLEASLKPVSRERHVWFEPVLPDGEPICSPCG